MSYYLIRINESPCLGDAMPALREWTFTPFPSSAASMNSLENTAQGVATNYLLAEGENLINENGELNGTLSFKIQCLNMKKDKSFNRLQAIQIEGFPLGLGVGNYSTVPNSLSVNEDSISKYFNVPVGKKFKIQLIGGFGSVRYVNVSNDSVVKPDKKISFEQSNYQPQLKGLNDTQNQIDRNQVIVDRNLGEGKHIFTFEALSVGSVAVLFRDMKGSRYYIHISVNANLCKDEIEIINDKGVSYKDNFENRNNYNVNPILNDNDFSRSIGGYCNCNVNDGPSTMATMPFQLPKESNNISEISHLKPIYENEKFIRGTRSLDFNNLDKIDNNNLPILPSKIYDLYVGEEAYIKIPSSAKSIYSIDILDKQDLDGTALGAGWGELNTGPSWSALKSDSQIILIDNMKITCKGPTNYLPAILRFSPKNSNSVIGAIPAKEKNIKVTTDPSNAILSFTTAKGETSYLTAESVSSDESILMTNSDFFVGIRCFCEQQEYEIQNTEVEEGGSFTVYNGGDLLPNAQQYFFERDAIKGQGLDSELNIIENPKTSNTQPTVNGSKEFKIAKAGNEQFIIFQEVPIFYTEAPSSSKGTNIHKPAFRRFDDHFFIEGKFWEELDKGSREEFNHKIETGDEVFPCWKEQGISIQPRGTWCINKNTFSFYSSSKIPVVLDEENNPKMINDLSSRSFIVLDESQKNKKYSIE